MLNSGVRAIPCLVLLFSFCCPADALAWTDATRLRMLRDALKATPPALNAILERYRKDMERGVLDPSRHEDEEVHYQHADGSAGLAAAGVVRKESEVRGMLQEGRPLRRFAYEMGVLAHLVSDVGFPLNASDADPREPLYREAYRAYIERYLGKIPFVLETTDSQALESGNLLGYMMASSRRAAEGYALIGPAFKDDGSPRTPAALDLRSVPFGIASLAYSRSVTDIVQVWRRLWASVHGDMRDTPYADAPPRERARIPQRPGRADGAP